MNADTNPGVSVELAAGARRTLIPPLAIGLLISGTTLLIVGITLTVVDAVMLGRQLEPDTTQVGLPAGGRFSKADRCSLLGLLVLIAGAILLFTQTLGARFGSISRSL